MTIATSEVVVVADTSRFRQSARSGVSTAMAGETTSVTVEPDMRGFRNQVNTALRGMRPVRIPVDPQTNAVIRELRQGFASMRPIQIPVVVRAGDFRNQVRAAVRDLPPLNVELQADMVRFLIRIQEALSRAAFTVDVHVNLVPDLDSLRRNIRGITPPPRIPVDADINVDADRIRRNLGRVLSGLGAGLASAAGPITALLRMGALAIVFANVATSAVALGAALAPAAGLLAALPAVFLGMRAAAAGLTLALQGVGDAFKAALTEDAEAFNKTLEDLSPRARAAAQEVRALRPAFEELRSTVQDAFFRQIQGEITATAQALRGPLQSGLSGIAEAWGEAALNATGYIRGARGVGNIRSVLEASRQGVNGLADGTNRLVAGLLQVAGVVSDAFGAELGGGIQDATADLGTFLQEAAQSGRAVAWVNGALDTLARLGDLLGNIGSILSGVFGAADQSGGGFLARLQDITRTMAEFVNSAEGQEAIGGIFQGLAAVASQLGPIIAALVTQLGGIGPAIVPAIEAIGPAIQGLIAGIGPALAALAPALSAVATGLGSAFQGLNLEPAAAAVANLVTALSPLLPLVVEFGNGILGVLAPALAAATPAIQALADVLVFIGPVLGPIAAGLTAVWLAISLFAAARSIILGIQAAWLALNLAFAASPIGFIITLVIGLVAAVIYAWNNIAPFREFILNLWSGVKEAWSAVVDWASGVWDQIVQGWQAGVEWVSGVWDRVAQVWNSGIAAIQNFGTSIVEFFTNLWVSITTAVSNGVTAVLNFFINLPGNILAGLQALPGLLVDLFTSAVANVAIALLTAIAAVTFIFTELPGMIGNALSSLGSLLVNVFTSAWNAVTAWVTGAFDRTVAYFRALPGRLATALSSLGSSIGNVFTRATNTVTTTLTGWFNSTVNFFRGLPGRIGSALSSLGSQIGGVFSRATSSATSTVSNWINNTVTFFRNLPGRIASALAALPGQIVNVFNTVKSRAEAVVTGMINSIVNFFRNLGSRIVSALGNIGGQIVDKIKSGLPDIVRDNLPFAAGGIVSSPTRALIGEAGREVVIPLTRPWRARELARESGLIDLLNRGGGGNTRNTTVNAPMTVHMSSGASDPRAVADQFADGVVRRLGMSF